MITSFVSEIISFKYFLLDWNCKLSMIGMWCAMKCFRKTISNQSWSTLQDFAFLAGKERIEIRTDDTPESFMREIQVTKKLKHANIIMVYCIIFHLDIPLKLCSLGAARRCFRSSTMYYVQ